MQSFRHGLMFHPDLGWGDGWMWGLATLGSVGFHFVHSHHNSATKHCTCLAYLTAVCRTA